MRTVDYGPFAFPCGFHPEGNSADQQGMSLRDWFAGQAMTSFLWSDKAWRNKRLHEVIDVWGGIAEDAYAMADAMLKERQE
jgi:hypothetical protein